MPDDQSKTPETYELSLYQANSCPAELLLPYNLAATRSRFFPIVYLQSKFKQSLWNMDSPLIMAIALIIGLHLVTALTLGILSILSIGSAYTAFACLVILPVSVMLLTFPVYGLLVFINLQGGDDWQNRLLGPTNIGLTESGFKLWWQGSAFYNYPNLSVWSDIFYIDLKIDEHSGDQSLHFIYQSGFGRRTIELPLRGFENKEDLQLVLSYFARYVLSDNQSEKFREQAKLGFEGALAKLTFRRDSSSND